MLSRRLIGILTLLYSCAGLAQASVTIVPSNTSPNLGDTFTVTIHGNFGGTETAGATLGLSYNSNVVSFVSGVVTGPFAAGGFFIQHPDAPAAPTSFDILAPGGCCSGSFDAAILTFQADAPGAANININDDCDLNVYSSCDQFALEAWYDSTTFDAIPNAYTQASVTVVGTPMGPFIDVQDSVPPVGDHLIGFGNVIEMTAAATQTITISNLGDADLTLGMLAQSDTLDPANGFSLDNDNCSGTVLAPTGTCTVDVNFTPPSANPFNETFDIPSDALNATSVTFSLSGTGVVAAPIVVVTDSDPPPDDQQIDFGTVLELTAAPDQTITISNAGNADLILGNLAQSDTLDPANGFSLSNDTCSGMTLTPGDSCTVTAGFTPPDVGMPPSIVDFSDSFDIPSNDTSNPSVTFTLSGTGRTILPTISLTTESVSFGKVGLFNTSSRTITVTNTGDDVLVIGDIAAANPLAAPFSINNDTCSGRSLGIMAQCDFAVDFTPGDPIAYNDSFDVPSNDLETPSVTVSVSGTGVVVGLPGGSALDPTTLLGLGLFGLVARRLRRRAAGRSARH